MGEQTLGEEGQRSEKTLTDEKLPPQGMDGCSRCHGDHRCGRASRLLVQGSEMGEVTCLLTNCSVLDK